MYEVSYKYIRLNDTSKQIRLNDSSKYIRLNDTSKQLRLDDVRYTIYDIIEEIHF